ncbi:hypothetical protein PSTT_11424 [Puccinia striiformis]|uniref:Uncharacterized protein n=1 Tax=Puccinia striiformis TaxID=27350 RepID=A0A2S4V0I6_9BASI|nr:hypothetical protein PSTT_11424 [Puccinia striiformis]
MSKNEQLRTITLTLANPSRIIIFIVEIFCSDLKRANLTANQIRIQNLKNPINESQDGDDQQTTTKGKINDLIVLPLLREQNFGEAEGERWDSGRCTSCSVREGNTGSGMVIDLNNNPNMKEEKIKIHFCIVSHGIFLIEFLTVLKNLYQKTQGASTNPEHFSNTGWERIKLTRNFVDGQPEERVKYEAVASNVVSHLDGLKRQPGGIGNLAWDPKQSKIDSFFSSK